MGMKGNGPAKSGRLPPELGELGTMFRLRESSMRWAVYLDTVRSDAFFSMRLLLDSAQPKSTVAACEKNVALSGPDYGRGISGLLQLAPSSGCSDRESTVG